MFRFYGIPLHMSPRDGDFFSGEAPLPPQRTGRTHRLKPWHRIVLCLALLVLLIFYLGWLLA